MKNFVGLLAFLIALALSCAEPARAEGALAIGTTGNIVKGGLAVGGAFNYKTSEAARDKAVQECRNFPDAPTSTRARCAVVSVFKNKCYSIVLDPKNGTPGAGWAVADTLDSAKKEATKMCRESAGSDREKFCVETANGCDSSN